MFGSNIEGSHTDLLVLCDTNKLQDRCQVVGDDSIAYPILGGTSMQFISMHFMQAEL